MLCCAAEALHQALQQQTSLTTSRCTTQLLIDPNPAADLAASFPLPSGPAQASPVPARALSPSLVMSSRGTALLVVSVQLKTGFLRLAAGCGAAQDQDLLQRLKQVHNHSSCNRIVLKICVSMRQVAQGHPCLHIMSFCRVPRRRQNQGQLSYKMPNIAFTAISLVCCNSVLC